MASPYNASESEPADDEVIDAGFDPLLFWDQNRNAILLAAGLLLLAAVAFGWYEFTTSQRAAAAEAALSTASTPEDFQQIIDRYAGTVAAGNASLMLGGTLRDSKKYDESIDVLQNFLTKYPDHPMVHAGLLSVGETLEAQGKADEALSDYEQVVVKYPDSFSAPLASLAQANLLKAQGKLEDARRVYENFVSQFPNSVFTNEAMAEMHLLRLPPTATAAPSPAAGENTSPLGLQGLSLPSATPAASPAASAAPSPSVAPALSGSTPHSP